MPDDVRDAAAFFRKNRQLLGHLDDNVSRLADPAAYLAAVGAALEPYVADTSMHEYVGGVKIWRVEDDTFRIKFYGPRSRLPFGGEPDVFAVYAEVPFASATKWDPKTWKLLGPEKNQITFKEHVKTLFPMILATLLNTSAGLPGLTPEDERVRAWWAKKPT